MLATRRRRRGLPHPADGEQLLPVDLILRWSAPGRNRGGSCSTSCAEAVPDLETHLIGGAELAAELDAKRAIDQGTRLAARL